MASVFRRWALVALLVASCAGELQPDDPNHTTCVVIDGVPHARVSAGPDGWCDYDGRTCACHGHGVGDQCEQAIADFDEACYGREQTTEGDQT